MWNCKNKCIINLVVQSITRITISNEGTYGDLWETYVSISSSIIMSWRTCECCQKSLLDLFKALQISNYVIIVLIIVNYVVKFGEC